MAVTANFDENDMDTATEVLVVGGGPVGLMLACELKLSGVTALVIEALERPTGLSKAMGIQGSGVELLDLRGLIPRFGPAALRTHGLSHFGGIRFEPPKTSGRQPRFLFVPQARTEEILAERAAELGVEVHRGCELLDLTPFETWVQARIRTPRGELTVQARYLVGCDGGHSRVRKLTGVAFPGLEPTLLLRLGDVKIDADVTGGPGELMVNGKPAPFRFGVPLGDGWLRVVTTEPYEKGFDRETPMTLEELQASVDRATPGMPRLKEARWLSRSTDASRLAETYCVGRVLLAGDAAHVHLPAGGPGLATGLSDAANLGWKLAAAVHGWAPEGLLDSYHSERHAAGERVMLHTRAQGALMNKTPQVAALREVLAGLLQHEQASRFTIDLLQGIDERFVSSLEVDTVNGKRPLSELLRLPRGLLLDARGNAAPHPRIDVVRVTSGPSQLVRPDGLVAWREGEGTFEEAARRWFG